MVPKCQPTDEERKERKRETSRKWKAANPERVREADRKRYIANPDKILEKNRRWRANNPEKVRERNLNYVASHRERERERVRQWQKDNPEKIAAIQNKRRALKAGNGGSYTNAEWVALCAKFNNRCIGPGPHHGPLCADHVVPIKHGGTSNISNIQPLCKTCNLRKGTKTIDYR